MTTITNHEIISDLAKYIQKNIIISNHEIIYAYKYAQILF